jgi:hypothetical protein
VPVIRLTTIAKLARKIKSKIYLKLNYASRSAVENFYSEDFLIWPINYAARRIRNIEHLLIEEKTPFSKNLTKLAVCTKIYRIGPWHFSLKGHRLFYPEFLNCKNWWNSNFGINSKKLGHKCQLGYLQKHTFKNQEYVSQS